MADWPEPTADRSTQLGGHLRRRQGHPEAGRLHRVALGQVVDTSPERGVERARHVEAVADPMGVDGDNVASGVDQRAARRAPHQGRGVLDAARYTVDTPVPYRISDLTGLIDERMGKLENKRDLAPYRMLKNHIETISQDGRYGFMFGSLTVYDGMTGMMENAFINVKGVPHTVTAEIVVPDAKTEGVIIAQAGQFGGWSLYVKDGVPGYHYNFLGLQRFTVASTKKLAPGKPILLAAHRPIALRDPRDVGVRAGDHVPVEGGGDPLDRDHADIGR